MTNQEAIIELHKLRPQGGIIPQKRAEMIDVAHKALEKQIPKKPVFMGDYDYCPCCKDEVSSAFDYCAVCGQRLDWSDI